MTTSVLSSVHSIPVSLFTVVTLESEYDSYVCGAVPQHPTNILSSLSKINLL